VSHLCALSDGECSRVTYFGGGRRVGNSLSYSPTIRIGSVDGKKIMELEICKLCLKDKPLISSHLMARGIHDFCRTPDDDPIFISSKVIMQSGRQLQHPLLCRECDGLLSREGENWVLPLLATAEGTFPFHDLLLEGAPGGSDGDSKMYAASRNPKIDVAKLAHFAMGVFWKASVHSWRGGETEPLIQFAKYGESARTFLLGKAPFPAKMVLIAGVIPPPVKTIGFCHPYRGSASGYHNFLFFVPGIEFALLVGNTISSDLKQTCFASHRLHPILVSGGIAGSIKGVIQGSTAKAHRASNVTKYLIKEKST
jgi:hypothetical protein